MRCFLLVATLGLVGFGPCGDLGPVPGTDSQADYAYPGCDDAGEYACANDLVLSCALDSIRAEHDLCEEDSDCVGAELYSCTGYGVCPPVAVNAASLEAFSAEAGAEVARYCDGGSCGSAGQCGSSFDRIACVSGRCRWLADAGT